MIRKHLTTQAWEPGEMVKVGFLTLRVVEKVATPGDYKPDLYVLFRNDVWYRFVPHNGLVRCSSREEAREF